MLIQICLQTPKTFPTIRFLDWIYIGPITDKNNANKERLVEELVENLDDQPYAMMNGNQVHMRPSSVLLGVLLSQDVCLGIHLSVGGYMLMCEGGAQTSGGGEGESTSGGGNGGGSKK